MGPAPAASDLVQILQVHKKILWFSRFSHSPSVFVTFLHELAGPRQKFSENHSNIACIAELMKAAVNNILIIFKKMKTMC